MKPIMKSCQFEIINGVHKLTNKNVLLQRYLVTLIFLRNSKIPAYILKLNDLLHCNHQTKNVTHLKYFIFCSLSSYHFTTLSPFTRHKLLGNVKLHIYYFLRSEEYLIFWKLTSTNSCWNTSCYLGLVNINYSGAQETDQINWNLWK